MYYASNPLMADNPDHEGGDVEKVFFLGGIASVVGGFSIIFYQAIKFLQGGAWTPYPVLSFIDTQSGALAQTLASNPALADALQQCPMSGAVITVGLILLFVGGKLSHRYD